MRIYIMEASDIEDARVMHNEDEVLQNLFDPHHVSEEEQKEWFKKISLSRTNYRYTVRRDDGDFVGVFRLDSVDYVHSSAHIGLDICRKWRGKGLAKEIYAYFLNYAFCTLGMNRLSIVALSSNVRGINLYKKLGFSEEGCEREAIFRHGRFEDRIYFGLLRREYYALLKRKEFEFLSVSR